MTAPSAQVEPINTATKREHRATSIQVNDKSYLLGSSTPQSLKGHSPSVSISSFTSFSFASFTPYSATDGGGLPIDDGGGSRDWRDLVPFEHQKENARRDLGALYKFENLAKGTMARIMKMRDRNDPQNVFAIKITPRRDNSHETSFERELYALDTIPGHPHIVKFIDSWADDSYFYLILELIDGYDLFSYMTDPRADEADESKADHPSDSGRFALNSLERGTIVLDEDGSETGLTEDEIREILYCVVSTMKYIHLCGFAHRDLKPENIVLDRGNIFSLKLVDFGTAIRVLDDQEYNEISFGTREYMAPERHRRHNAAELLASEIWSVGVLAYEMLTQYRPFENVESICDESFTWTWPEDLVHTPLDDVESETRIPLLGRTQSGNTVRSVSEEAKSFVRMCLIRDVSARASWDDLLTSPFMTGGDPCGLRGRREIVDQSDLSIWMKDLFVSSPCSDDHELFSGSDSAHSRENSLSNSSWSNSVSRSRAWSHNSYLGVPSKGSGRRKSLSSMSEEESSSSQRHREAIANEIPWMSTHPHYVEDKKGFKKFRMGHKRRKSVTISPSTSPAP